MYGFGDDSNPFSQYSRQMHTQDIWPLAVLLDLEVQPALRKNGYGGQLLARFEIAASAKGAKSGFLRVGWPGGTSPEGMNERNWRIGWYQRSGWHLLRNMDESDIVPFMYRIFPG